MGLVVALALGVLGGFLLPYPPWSIPGALVLVLASLGLSVSLVWTRRKSWADPWPPDVTPSLKKQLRNARVRLSVNAVVLMAGVALMVLAIVEQYWKQVLVPVFAIVSGVLNLVVNRRTLRALERQAEGEL